VGERRRRRVGGLFAGLVVVAGVLTAQVGAGAQTTVTAAQFQALAERAVDDPRALAQLRAVQQVDGHPVDVAQALAGAEGPALAARLHALAGGDGAPPAASAAAEARQQAATVLRGRRFNPPHVPRPFAGVLRALGRALRPLVRPFGWLWDTLAPTLGAQIAVVAAAFLIAAVVSVRLLGRRSARALHRARPLGPDAAGLDPDELERRAADAERAGDLATAVRLRFVAGVLRLDRAGAISYRSSLTTGQLRSAVASPSFADLAAAFDEIAYGGRPAQPSDVERATTAWPRVLADVRR